MAAGQSVGMAVRPPSRARLRARVSARLGHEPLTAMSAAESVFLARMLCVVWRIWGHPHAADRIYDSGGIARLAEDPGQSGSGLTGAVWPIGWRRGMRMGMVVHDGGE